MGNVLWSHSLKDGRITADPQDLRALYRHTRRLDSLCRKLRLPPLSSLCDSTDLLVNLGRLDLPDGMDDTNQLMAMQGVWIPATEARAMLEALLAHIRREATRFGLLRNEHAEIVEELERCIAFARRAAADGARFNFAIVL